MRLLLLSGGAWCFCMVASTAFALEQGKEEARDKLSEHLSPLRSASGGYGGFSVSLDSSANEATDEHRVDGGRMGYNGTDLVLKGRWDNKYKMRGGLAFGAVLDEDGHLAIGGGFTANQRAAEGYGQVQFVAPSIDPNSQFTIGGHVSQTREFFETGGADVASYTTYGTWFKRSYGDQSAAADTPEWMRSAVGNLLDTFSAFNVNVAHTYSPKVKVGTQGSPEAHLADLGTRAVTQKPFGEFFPVVIGGSVNLAHYDHVDDTEQWKAIWLGGSGIAFRGGDYFGHSTHWLVGFGGDVNTEGVFGGTTAVEFGPVAVSYRYQSDQNSRVLLSFGLTDLLSPSEKTRISTLNVADGGSPLSLSTSRSAALSPEGISADGQNILGRLGFLPPTGAETRGRDASRGRSGTSMRLSANDVVDPPQMVREALTRSSQNLKDTRSAKNNDIMSASANSGGMVTNIGVPNVLDFGVTKGTTGPRNIIITGTSGLTTGFVISRLNLSKVVNNNGVTNDPTDKSGWSIVDNGNGTMTVSIQFTANASGGGIQDDFILVAENSGAPNSSDTFSVFSSNF